MIAEKRVLLLTGQMAFQDLKRVTTDFPLVSVECLPITVAAFTTPRIVQKHVSTLLKEKKPDLILVSGLARGDFTQTAEQIGIPVMKGTRYLTALPPLLRNLHQVVPMLSAKYEADSVIQKILVDQLRDYMKHLERETVFGKRNFRLRSGYPIGIDFPPRVMAEVVDVTTRSVEESIATAQFFAEWADILDVGATIDEHDPERIAEIVTELRRFGLPISVDSLDRNEILAGVDAGAEIVLSVDMGNLGVTDKLPEDAVLVCLPTNISAGLYPPDPNERAQACHKLCDHLRTKGFEKIIADPLMEAPVQPGLMNSLRAYHQCRILDENLPLLAGFANVTEFVDSDTAGMNALLACLGIELGISVFLSTEERPSTYRCISELKSAALMGFVAGYMKSPPKEIGATAYVAKSSGLDVQAVSMDESYRSIEDRETEWKLDKGGYFRIGIDRHRNRVLCEHRGRKGVVQRVASENASAILQEILTKGLVTTLSHAAYLGSELTKAEIALRSGHNYRQDAPWEIELSVGV
ncbi:MAG: dihydropteroate synthase-like protein [Candidatus Thorarchaeota archaeon]